MQQLSKEPGVVTEVERELQEGLATGVSSTPTLVIIRGGKRYPVPATTDYSLLRTFLDAPK